MMPTHSHSTEAVLLSEQVQSEIDYWLTKYPPNQRQSAIIPALSIAQKQNGGWLSEGLINAVADYIQIPRINAYEVATFYSMFELKAVGRHKINICTNVSCMLNGCDRIVDHLKKQLNIDFNETTSDQQFTLKEAECLGACIQAPVMTINHTYYENLTTEQVDQLLNTLATDEDSH